MTPQRARANLSACKAGEVAPTGKTQTRQERGGIGCPDARDGGQPGDAGPWSPTPQPQVFR